MAVRPADVRAIVERVCARPEVLDACARGDLGTVIDAFRTGGLTQGRISGLTGIPQGRLSEWNTGKREPRGISTFRKFADGVGMPPAARRALGLDSEAPPAAPASSPDLSMPYPDTPADATRNAPDRTSVVSESGRQPAGSGPRPGTCQRGPPGRSRIIARPQHAVPGPASRCHAERL